jgi:DNA-binding IclR family transcriptional regulator
MVKITHQWAENRNGRKRVRAVVETLNWPLTITEIADKADASQSTATTELERLKRDKWVRETIVVRQ